MIDGTLYLLVAALVVDRLIGDPDWFWRRLPHPVVVFGAAIGWFDRVWNRPAQSDVVRQSAGVATITLLLGLSLAGGFLLHRLFVALGIVGSVAEITVVAVFLAQKSLGDHVLAVATALKGEGLDGGRRAVSMIVGRDPATLDEAGVSRAAIESLAENFSDGVVAPAFWYAILGLPGLLAYKMLNTADSMIGHKSERYLRFGWASARLDDLVNLVPARLSGLLVVIGALTLSGWQTAGRSLRICCRDHGLHRSPNSGWPESAMAGALGLQLVGPRVYGGKRVDEPMMNPEGRSDASATDIEAGVGVFYRACTVLAVLILLLAILSDWKINVRIKVKSSFPDSLNNFPLSSVGSSKQLKTGLLCLSSEGFSCVCLFRPFWPSSLLNRAFRLLSPPTSLPGSACRTRR